ncbi:MAG: bifunctional phosphoribosylaminoimidazolecarboxamide formyltransferase/IMP cyclohydrolase [Treponema sp.]
MKFALISVSNKTGIVEFVKLLLKNSYTILASSGTFKLLKENNLSVIEVKDYTGFDELLSGRVKTLHPFIHAGLLARDIVEDEKDLEKFHKHKIDLLVCNLYPFENTIAKPHVTEEEAIENIDIGGVALLRSAAKNYKRVLVVPSYEDYEEVAKNIKEDASFDEHLRVKMAIKAFDICAKYDVAITNWLNTSYEKNYNENVQQKFFLQDYEKTELRYGENPHQKAESYKPYKTENIGVLQGNLLQGKALSYNNILDCDLAYRASLSFSPYATAVVVKHQTPIGIASLSKDENMQAIALRQAIKSDPVSAYGGIIALNKEFDEACCKEIEGLFVECIVALSFSDGAREYLSKRKNCRLITLPFSPLKTQMEMKSIIGGILVQEIDIIKETELENLNCATEKKATKEELSLAIFAWKACQLVKSNAILLANKEASCFCTVGIGTGQPNRVDAAKDAIKRAGDNLKGAIMASDGFIPFTDTIKLAHENGINLIIQPGGSIRDDECIKYCNENDIAMLFTKIRHFKH